MNKKRLILILVIISVPALYFMYGMGIVRFNYPSSIKFPIQGIDVSHHQADIDWEKVAQNKNIHFAYIKATEGGDFKDKNFNENWNEAKRFGLLRGAYHFFTFCRAGKEQARNFMEMIPEKDSGELPIAIDLEFGGNCSKKPSLEELLYELNSFINETKKRFPQKPVLYVTPGFFYHYLKDNSSQFPQHHLWLRNIFFEPQQKNCEEWSIWQYADNYIIGGINQPVDMNAFCNKDWLANEH